jgi:hypothetical protein
MSEITLETPSPLDSMYLSRGDEVDSYRPVFTGDVWARVADNGALSDMVIVLQHPCALRVAGTRLMPELLTARITEVRSARTLWSTEVVRLMPLPELLLTDQKFAADFTHLELVNSDTLAVERTRIAVLSMLGVNLLLQRWVHHSSRVTIKTSTYNEQTSGPYNEADLAADWCEQLETNESDPEQLQEDFHDWIRQPWSNESSRTRQSMLDDPQQRPSVRRAMSRELKRRSSGRSTGIAAESPVEGEAGGASGERLGALDEATSTARPQDSGAAL